MGIYSGDTKHLPNHNMYTQNKLHHKHVPGTSIHFANTLGTFYTHVYQGHAAGTKSQPTQTIKHSSGNTSQGLVAAVNYCFVHMRKAVVGVCIGSAWQGQHQIAHIHSQMQPLHVPGTCAVKSCFIHTRRNVAGTFIWSSQQGQNVFTHTQLELQLLHVLRTCTHKVSHCVSSLCHTISHLCFVTATCPAKVHLVELYTACCSNECCKKDDFYRVNSLLPSEVERLE